MENVRNDVAALLAGDAGEPAKGGLFRRREQADGGHDHRHRRYRGRDQGRAPHPGVLRQRHQRRAEKCGGCSLQNYKYEEQLKYKFNKVKNLWIFHDDLKGRLSFFDLNKVGH